MQLKKRTKTEEIVGNLEKVTAISETSKQNRCKVGLNVGDKWFNLWGSEENLERILNPLNVGDQVKVQFKTRSFNGKDYFDAVSVSAIKQSTIGGGQPSPSSVPVSQSYTILVNDKIDLKRLSDALLLLKSDLEFLIKEIGKIES